MEKKERWIELVETIAKERDPEKVRLACEEIDRIAANRDLQARPRGIAHSTYPSSS